MSTKNSNKKVIIFTVFSILILAVCFVFIKNMMWFPFNDYNNDIIIGAVNPPKLHSYAHNYIGTGKSEGTILKVDKYKLNGVETFLNITAEDDYSSEIQCSFVNLKGKFKIIHITEEQEIITLFDSQIQESGEKASINYNKGANELRIVGSKLDIQNLLIQSN